MAPPTQGIWRSDNYINTFKLMDCFVFDFINKMGIIYYIGDQHKY